jgi:nitroreductase
MVEQIMQRRSIVCFDKKPVASVILEELFEAARWAPSAFNQQPWRFIIGQKGSMSYDKIFSSLNESNQQWAITAPVLMISVAHSVFSHNGKPNIHAWHDTAMAYTNLVVQATSMELFVHPMAGFSSQSVIDNFNIPLEFQPVAAIALGYKGSCEGLPEAVKNRENRVRERKAITEIVFSDYWGNPFNF